MLLKIRRAPLLKALTRCCNIADKKNHAFSYVALHAIHNVNEMTLQLTSQDANHIVTEYVEAEVTESGVLCVPVGILHAFVRKAKVDVNIEKIGNLCQVSAGNAILKINTVFNNNDIASDLSELQQLQPFATLKINRAMFETIAFAMSQDENRHTMHGICIHIVTNNDIHEARTIATDAHRLAIYVTHVTPPDLIWNIKNVSGETQVILTKKTITEILKLFVEEAEELLLCLCDKYVYILVHQTKFYAKTIHGTFPKYDGITQKYYHYHVECNREELLDAVECAAIISEDKIRVVNLSLQHKQHILKISALHYSAGFAENSVFLLQPSETDWQDSFNVKYIIDAMRHIKSDNVMIFFDTQSSQIKITDSTTHAAQYIIMPMR